MILSHPKCRKKKHQVVLGSVGLATVDGGGVGFTFLVPHPLEGFELGIQFQRYLERGGSRVLKVS